MNAMTNWKLLNEIEYTRAWNFVYEELHFNPNKKGEKLIRLKEPNEYYDISQYYNEGYREEIYTNLHSSAIKCFIRISKGKRLYAMDWQHESYSFTPDLPFETDEFEEWLIPFFPNGDYTFFMTQDFSTGAFADGINLSISLFGEPIITAFMLEKPLIFNQHM